nr:hypothetical protein [Tanacetum cinerariifolium]
MWIQQPIGYDKHALSRISHWGRKRQQIYGFAVNWESARDVDDGKLYQFKEGDFKRLRIQDIKDMLLLLVQGKLTNLTVEERFAFNVSLRMFTRSIIIQRCVEDLQLGVESFHKKLNLTKPDTYRSDLKRKEAYIAYSNLRGFIYQNKDKKNRLLQIDELHKFSDGMLIEVCTALDDCLKGIQMQYLPQSIWRKSDKNRAAAMIQAIDKRVKTRRIMRSLERKLKDGGEAPGCRFVVGLVMECSMESWVRWWSAPGCRFVVGLVMECSMESWVRWWSGEKWGEWSNKTILLGLLEDIYAAVDNCETAQEIWLRVPQMMKGSNIGIQEKKDKLFNERERFTSNEGESIKSYFHRFLKFMNDLKRNKHFLIKIASNLKFLNNLQPEWSRHVTIVHQTKDLHTADYTQLYDFLKYNKNENYMQQPMPNPKDITDPTTAINMALALMANAFKLSYSTPTNNNHWISSNTRNRQITQPGNLNRYNAVQNVRNEVAQNPRVQNVRNQNGLIGVLGTGNQNRNGNLGAARAEGNAVGPNGNQKKCYNCRGVGHFARNCTQILMKFEKVNANFILMANLQQASTSGTQSDKAPVYDSDGSAEVHDYENCDDNEIFNMFTQEEQYTELLEPIPETTPTGFESRPPMFNKENYVPWSYRLLCYAKSIPNGKLIHDSIINGPYVRRMIPEPGDPNREVPVNETLHVQTDDELTEKELKQIEANDQAIQTILLGLPEDIYAAVGSYETAQEIWFTSNEGESIESYYNRFLKLINDLKRNKHFPEKIASNLMFLNNLQPEWSQHVTIVYQTKDLHKADYTQLYNFLKYNQKEVGIQLQAKEFDLMANAANRDEIREVNANCILMANLQQASTSGTQSDKDPIYDSDGSAEVHDYENSDDNEIFNMFTQEEQHTELLEPISEPHQVPQNDNNVISEVTSVKQSRSFTKIVKDENFPIVNQVDARVQNFEIQFLKEAAKFVGDFKSLAKEADKSLAKDKVLELEIERLLSVVVSQDIMSIVQKISVVDTSNLQTELECTKERFENYIIKKENEYAKLWNDWYKTCDECKFDKISYDKAYKDMQQKIECLQAQLGDLKAQLFNKVSDQKDIKRGTSVNTKFSKQSIVENLPKVGETHALSKLVTSNSFPTPQETKVVKNNKVITPGMFRINPFKASRVEKHVPNNVRASARTKPITVSQPPVITKKDVNSDSNGLSSIGIDNTKTRRP